MISLKRDTESTTMIKSATLVISPEMRKAIDEHRQDEGLYRIYSQYGFPGDNGDCEVEVSATMAEDCCESWFDPDHLPGVIEDDIITIDWPEICRDPLISDLVQTVLQIYRLTVSL